MTQDTRTYSIVIPHFNDVARLRRCLEALMPQVDFELGEVIVADNASTQDITPIAEAFPQVRIVTQPTPGAGPARNAGADASRGHWLFFIDADCVPGPGWVARGLAIAKPGHVIGGRVDVFHETPPPMSGAEAFEAVFAFHMRTYLERDGFLASAHLVTSRAVYDDVGGFRQAVSEDKDWSQRAAQKGHGLGYDDGFVAAHPSRSDWAALRRKWRRLTSETFLLEGRGIGGRLKWVAKALLMPISVAPHGMQILRSRKLTGREKARALATLARLRLTRMVWMLGQVLTGRA